jgi:hypothetical protein
LDNDNDMDIALFEDAGRHRIGINDGNGSYSFGAELNSFLGDSSSPSEGEFTFADVGQDGNLDLFESIVSATGSRRMWSVNDDNILGNVTFIAPDAYKLCSADMSGDGFVDLVESRNMSDINIYYDGVAGYFDQNSLVVHSGSGDIRNLRLVDIDNDGDTDIIFSSSGTGTTWVYYNSQTGDQ